MEDEWLQEDSDYDEPQDDEDSEALDDVPTTEKRGGRGRRAHWKTSSSSQSFLDDSEYSGQVVDRSLAKSCFKVITMEDVVASQQAKVDEVHEVLVL